MSNRTSNYYEGMFVTKGGGGEDAWDQSRSAVKGVLEDHDADIDYVENWADQQFEKEIEKQRRGKYILTYFQADPSSISEIKQDTQMNERILRVLILNREKETTYQDMIQERIEANKEDEEEEAEEDQEEQEEEEEETSTEEEDVEAPDVDEDAVPEEAIDDVPPVDEVDDEVEADSSDEEVEEDSSEQETEEAETSSEDEVARAEAGAEES